MSLSTAATPLSPSQKLQQSIANPNASRAMSATASVQPATPQTIAAAQAQQGAAHAQAPAQQQAPQAEVFNAPMLTLPQSPTTRDVLRGLTTAMADPTVNEGSAQKLYSLHEQLLNAERGMIQAVIDGMLI